MQLRRGRVFANGLMVVTFSLVSSMVTFAQEPTQQSPQDQPAQEMPPNQDAQPPRDVPADQPPPIPREQRDKPANGRKQRDLSVEAYAVVPGTKFLVRLENELDTRETHEKSGFKVRTLEPLEAGSGIYLPAGAEIRGHVSRVEPAGIAGRAKIWLTFDDIHTRFGSLPIVAEVVSVPGDHSVKTVTHEEGLIEGRASTQEAAGQAAATAAALSAVKSVENRDKDKKAIAQQAALAAITAYLMESGRGHELDLPPGAKLELELERTLYLLKE